MSRKKLNPRRFPCFNDSTRHVIKKIELTDIPENEEAREWPAKYKYINTYEDAYTG